MPKDLIERSQIRIFQGTKIEVPRPRHCSPHEILLRTASYLDSNSENGGDTMPSPYMLHFHYRCPEPHIGRVDQQLHFELTACGWRSIERLRGCG